MNRLIYWQMKSKGRHSGADIKVGGNDRSTAYAYDANSNALTDSNKGVSYKWDYNNMLAGAYFDVGTQDFTRTASGRLLCRTYCPNAKKVEISPEPFKPSVLRAASWGGGIFERPTFTPVIYHYHKYGHYEYTDDQQTRINTTIGYRDSNGTHIYVRDWQGNVRAVVSRDGGSTVFDQTTYYYPYGLPMAESTSPQTNPYKYTAKELLTDQALNLADHGARFYDPATARWLSRDPLEILDYSVNSYSFCHMNPIDHSDPSGLTDFFDINNNLVKSIPDGYNAVFQQTGMGTDLYYKFIGYNDNQTGVKAINITSAIQEQQILNLGNPDLQQNANEVKGTHCNQATQNVLRTVDSALKPDETIMVNGCANDMTISLTNGDNPNFIEVSTHAEALENAKNGGLSILAHHSEGDEQSGHVATYSVGDNLKKGDIANIGLQKYTGFKSLNWTISKSKKRHYFILLPNMLSPLIVVPNNTQENNNN